MRRPDDHFVGSDRLSRLLKRGAPRVRPIRPDIDNLLKFVLDGMNERVYADDRQVVMVVAFKKQDSIQPCEGRTVVRVKEYPQP